MKKIGITTYWNTEENYGQILQIYALQQVLKDLGTDPFLIKHNNFINKTDNGLIKRFIKTISSLSRMKDALKKRIAKEKKININVVDRNFQLFKTKYIKQTTKIYSYDDLLNTPPKADCFICGSDQIWNYPNPIFLLSWVKYDIPKFSYAASFGTAKFPKYLLQEYKKALSSFKAVSVREKSGINICKELGINNASHVLDPTLLLTQEDYINRLGLSINTNTTNKKKYILLYLLGNKSTIDIEYIKKYAKHNNLEIIFIPSQNCTIKDFNPIYPTINEWLELIKSAEIVITNSFHGTVFSIIFKKQFYTISLSKSDSKMNERINSLFEILNINQYYNNKIEPYKLDYNLINNNLQNLRNESFSFINTIINSI